MVSHHDFAYYQKMYKTYVQSLCIRYANQQSLSSIAEIEQCVREIQPLMAKLASSVFRLIKYLSVEETREIFNHLMASDQKDFYEWMYKKYEYKLDNKLTSEIAAQDALFYGLLLRDFYSGDFEKIARGGHVGPILIEITRRYLAKEPYDAFCGSIYFPIDEVPYMSGSGIQSLVEHCKEAIVPNTFNKEVFTEIIHEHLEEMIDTMHNLICANNEEKRAEQEDNIPENKTPLFCFQAHIASKKENKYIRPQGKKVSFAEIPITHGIVSNIT